MSAVDATEQALNIMALTSWPSPTSADGRVVKEEEKKLGESWLHHFADIYGVGC